MGWRLFKERVARQAMTLGGLGVIGAIVLIFFYLLYVVVPLFRGAELEAVSRYPLPVAGAGPTLYWYVEEQNQIALRVTADARAVFFDLQDGAPIQVIDLPRPPGARVSAVSAGAPGSGLLVIGFDTGALLVLRHRYESTYPDDRRVVVAHVEYPLGEEPIVFGAVEAVTSLAVQGDAEATTIVAVTRGGVRWLLHFRVETSLFGDVGGVARTVATLGAPGADTITVALDPTQQRLWIAQSDGTVQFFDVRDKDHPVLLQTVRLTQAGARLQRMALLPGGHSLVVVDSSGAVSQWFAVRDENNSLQMRRVRAFGRLAAEARAIATERNRRVFAVALQSGEMAMYHATAQRHLAMIRISDQPLLRLALSPRGNGLLAEDAAGDLHYWSIDNPHPELSWSALWGKVWYEGYEEPDYVWQSSSASNDFEPKFSLTPLAFGTVKAAFYAMLVAIPLALLGAIYTAYFMAPRMRRIVKPTIEIMEALPTVILGFLAGLWLAPFLERHVPGVFALLLLLPAGVLACSFAWHRLPRHLRARLPEGWDAALLVPVVILIGWGALALSRPLELWWFGGNIRGWLTNEMRLDFDQRNALVIGIAMGFAVIPTIFSMAEDAIFSVPRQLSYGSFALGATPWQSLARVVLPTASPGIFSAIMIGLGRAVGETMIVLMATGNTPVMDFSIFQGMRTLSANIAVEMPESEVNSTHFRVLFLAALVLFLATFVLNTLAEVVRQRLRRKYSAL